MMYDFDEKIERRGTGCVKYDLLPSEFGREGLIPLWVADMDFRTPDFITDAIRRRLEHPVFGYSLIPEDYFPTIASWVRSLHGWEVRPEHIRFIPGIVKGISMVLDCFFGKDTRVMIQPPVYHPFRIVPESMGYGVVRNPLIPEYDADGFLSGYRMDFDDMERKLSSDPSIRVLILSNPHNPCGVAWQRGTLERLAGLAERHDILVISDEIHCEMMLGRTHIPFASVSEAAARHSITFQAPSKTFNIAGIVSSYAIVPDKRLRDAFFGWLEAGELCSPGIFSVVATKAAYSCGRQWRDELLAYLRGNYEYLDSRLRAKIPEIRAVRPDASFLVWLDCRKLALTQKELNSLFMDKAGLALNDGEMFGSEGQGFLRLNIGCPRSTLNEALSRLEAALGR